MMFRSRSLGRFVCFIVCVLTVANVGYAAIDLIPAPFRTYPEGQGGTTFQSWDFSTAADLMADTDLNQYGHAVATVGPNTYHQNTLQFFQGTWKLGTVPSVDAMSVDIPIDLQNPASITDFWVQITYSSSIPIVSLNGQPLAPAAPEIPIFNGWKQVAFAGQIPPNTGGIIEIVSSYAVTAIDGMIIETISVPEPISIALMGFGALLIRRKK